MRLSLCSHGTDASGNSMTNVAPGAFDESHRLPPCACTSDWLTGRPRPTARSELRVVKNGSKIRVRIVRRHAGAGVFHVHLNRVLGRRQRDAQPPLGVSGQRLFRVHHQIQQRLRELPLVAADLSTSGLRPIDADRDAEPSELVAPQREHLIDHAAMSTTPESLPASRACSRAPDGWRWWPCRPGRRFSGAGRRHQAASRAGRRGARPGR